VTGSAAASDELNDVSVHRLQCLRHLRQADEVIRAAQVPLRDVMKGRDRTPERFDLIAKATEDRVNELEVLCARPLLFHSARTFGLVRRLKERLRDFAERLRANPEQALNYWRAEMEPEFEYARNAAFEEVERVLA
jgi:hypothetical protein